MRCVSASVLFVLVIVSFGCGDTPPAATPAIPSATAGAADEVEGNKAVVRRWVEEAHNKRNLAVVSDVYAPTTAGISRTT